MSVEHDFTPGKAAQIGAVARAGDSIYTGRCEPETDVKLRRHRQALAELRGALAARALELVETGPFFFAVKQRKSERPETCTACGYRVSFSVCQRCGTRHSIAAVSR